MFSFGLSHFRISFSFFKNKSLVLFAIFPFPLAFPFRVSWLVFLHALTHAMVSLCVSSFYHGVFFNVAIVFIIFFFPPPHPRSVAPSLVIKSLASLFRCPFSAHLWRCTYEWGKAFCVSLCEGPRKGCFYLKEEKRKQKLNGFVL